MEHVLGMNIHRKEAWDKVAGRARYTDDFSAAGHYCARLLTSPHAHARILNIDVSQALCVTGVKAVLTGQDCEALFGPLLADRPALAREVVRYAGEPVALVVAIDEASAALAVRCIKATYEPLPALLAPSQSLAFGAPLIHPKLSDYKRETEDVLPEFGTNVASRFRIRKGNAHDAFSLCAAVVEKRFTLPPSDHVAMEVRAARAEIGADGGVIISTSSQAPFTVRKQIKNGFAVPAGNIQVRVPFVGGGFGGKAPVVLEILAYLASKSVGGRPVRVILTREEDMASMPARLALEAVVRIGADAQGFIRAAEMTYHLDCGAYADIAPNMAKAIAVDCTGPYRIDNITCDSLCVYTNHTFATSYRSFAHESFTFCLERTMDALSRALSLDPLVFRLQNAIRPGDSTPSGVLVTPSLTGDLPQCIEKVGRLAHWRSGAPVQTGKNIVRAQGAACFWKTTNSPTNAVSGAFLTCNPDGSVNLITGVVEMGSGGHTCLAQILAERLKMDPSQVHIVSSVDTRAAPEHWKTVASLTSYMAGHAVLRAADDLIDQIKRNGAAALGCGEEDVEVAGGRVFARQDPVRFIALKALAQGYLSPAGTSIGEPALGRGGFMLKGLTQLDPVTGKGKTGPQWTLGAQVVEVEADLCAFSYRILTASTVIDVGCAINPEAIRGMIAGGMTMGLSLASKEGVSYDEQGVPCAPNLRTYKVLHIGQEPECRVDFVETPDENAPYGLRSYSEHGIIGIPAALGNALCTAFGVELDQLPIRPETIWRACKGMENPR